MSDFLGLRIALSALHAQRRALDVTGQNVANVNTEGYSRQRVDLAADAGPVTPAVHSVWTKGGLGVTSGTVARLRDQFLELRGYQEHAVAAGLERTQSVLARVELAFGEPSDTGLASLLSDFWAGWDDVANAPSDLAARTQLVERATTLAAAFSQLDTAMAELRSSGVAELETVVGDVNATASLIAELNGSIQSAVRSGLSPNELTDQRDLLIAGLAEQVGVTVHPDENGMANVFVGGTALVRGTRTETLAVTVDTDPAQTVRVVWARDGYPAAVTGRSGAILSAAGDVIPRYRAGLAAVAQQVHDEVNALHSTGFALDGSTGRDFFTMVAGRLGVEAAVGADPALVAASASAGATLDGSLAQRLAELAGSSGGASADSPDDAYRELVVALGVEAQAVNRRVDVQGAITRHTDEARESAAGVNLDEELANMVSYQHAYDAAARMLTAVDEALDTLINRTGLVGR